MTPVASSDLPNLTESTFTPDRTRTVAIEACRRAGLDPSGMTLLRHQTNAVYLLATAPVVIKVVRPGIRHTEDVVRLVRWLTTSQIPTAPLLDVELPLHIAGCAVTLWRFLPQSQTIAAGDIAGPLLSLHSLENVPFELPQLDAVSAIQHSIETSTLLSEIERASLDRHLEDVFSRLKAVEVSRNHLIHGDPQHRNTLWDNGVRGAVLIDWESAVFGPVEWDLVTIEVHCRRFGFARSEYDEFCERYGRDVREWSGYATFRDLRELRMITTNARKSAAGSPQATEVHRRIAQLGDDPSSRWFIL